MPETLDKRIALLEQKIADNDRFYQQRYDFDQSALKVALATAETRLDTLNGHKQEMQAERATLMPREQVIKLLSDAQEKAALARETMTTRLEAQLRAMEMRVETIGRPNWIMLASSIGVITAVVSGLFIVIGLKIDAAVSPVNLEITQLKANAAATIAQQAERTANRERQITALNTRQAANDLEGGAATQAIASLRAQVTANTGRIAVAETTIAAGMAERRGAQATLQGQMVEAETQMKTISVVINLMKDDVHQMFGALWSKVDPALIWQPKSYRPELHERGSTSVPSNSK